MFGDLNALIWVDDLLGYSKDAKSLLETIELVFKVCLKHGRKINPNKCEHVAKSTKFYGRLIDSNGVKFSPRNYEELHSMSTPRTAGELMELFHAANWICTSIPRFSQLIKPLRKLLEVQYTIHGNRKKIRVKNHPLSAWGTRMKLDSLTSFRRFSRKSS